MAPIQSLGSQIITARWPHWSSQSRKGQFLLSFGAAILIALAAQVSLPIPFTPVPLCLAPQVVCWLAWSAPAIAPRAVALYLLGAGLQLPLLAIGRGGCAQLVGPLGGYLMGYFAASLLVGQYRRSCGLDPNWKNALFAQIIGSWLIITMGVLRLSLLYGLVRAWQLGGLPFLIGDFLIKAPLMSALGGFAKSNDGGRA